MSSKVIHLTRLLFIFRGATHHRDSDSFFVTFGTHTNKTEAPKDIGCRFPQTSPSDQRVYTV